MSFRIEIEEILDICVILTVAGERVGAAGISGKDGVPLSTLSIDSLASMQFCIELENRFGWSITPEELLAFYSLAEIERALQDHVNRQ